LLCEPVPTSLENALVHRLETARQEAAQPAASFYFSAGNAALSLRRLQCGRVDPTAEAQRSFGPTCFFKHGLLLGARRQKLRPLSRVFRERGEAIL